MKRILLTALVSIASATETLAVSKASAFIDDCALQGQQAEVNRLLTPFSSKVAYNIIAFTRKQLDGELTPESCLFALRGNADRLSRMVTTAQPSSITPVSRTQVTTNLNTSITPTTPAIPVSPVSPFADPKSDYFESAFETVRVDVDGIEALFSGRVSSDITTVRLNRQAVAIRADGSWQHRAYLPEAGLSVDLEMIDRAGAMNGRAFNITRGNFTLSGGVEPIEPKLHDRSLGKDRVAVIIGVDGYRSLPNASFAEADALSAYKMFTRTLNIPAANVKDLIGANANEVNIKLAFRQWLASRVVAGQTELYIFYAGHGLTDGQGEKRYWMPYDGHSQLLDDTAIAFSDVMEAVNRFSPAKTFVIADSCYSGASRTEVTLTAQRPIRVVKKLDALPDNTYLFAATQPDQTALPYAEAQHGLFSYWWLKGLEGGADLNSDRQISAGELNSFTRDRVSRQSGGLQVPEFSGNPDTVVLAWD